MEKNKENPTGLQVITVGETTFPVEVRNGRIAVNLTEMGKGTVDRNSRPTG